MKNKLIVPILIGIVLSSCCRKESFETARYELSPDERELIPYKQGEKINFIHSNGYTFDFNVTKDNIEWIKHSGFCEHNCCGMDYFSYQTRTATLESSYPRFTIELSLGSNRFYDDYIPQVLNIEINYDYFIQLPYDSLTHFICDSITKAVFYETIVLNGKTYTEVTKTSINNYYTAASEVIRPQAIYYNKYGIIQIETSNNETYTINN